MKKLISAFMAILLFASCQKEDHGDTNLHITGHVKGLTQGKLYIKKIVDTSLVSLDTIVVKGESDFESHLKLESPEMLYLFLDRGQTASVDDKIPFFAEPGNIKIETTIDEFYNRAKVTGSKNQKVYEDYVKMKKRFTNQNLDLVEKNLEATKASNVKQLDSIRDQMDLLEKKRYLFTANFALNNGKYEVAPFLALSEISNINIKYLDTIAKSMTPDVAKSKYGKLLTAHIADRKKQEAELNK